MKKSILLFLILSTLFFLGCVQEKAEQKIAFEDLELTSAWWTCNKDECDKTVNCGGLFEYNLSVPEGLKSGSDLGQKPCKPFVDGKEYPEPYDVYFINGDGDAGIPLEHNVYKEHIIKLCCSNNWENFHNGNYDICKEISLQPLCEYTKDINNIEKNNSENQKEKITPKIEKPICGNDICEENEIGWCVDCPTTCKSNYCNSKISVYCEDCYGWQLNFLPVVFNYQNEIYDCLSNYFGYQPKNTIDYNIDKGTSQCEGELPFYCDSMGSAGSRGVHFYGFAGIHRPGQSSVTDTNDIRADIHETTHVFTLGALGSLPSWFNEGISIYVNEKLSCHPKQFGESRLTTIEKIYPKIKSGELNIQNFSSNHDKGSLFFAGLETDYGCDTFCVKRILNSLKSYRENCVGSCWDKFKDIYPSSTNKDFVVPIIDNSVIKKVSEETTGKDLTQLFNILDIK